MHCTSRLLVMLLLAFIFWLPPPGTVAAAADDWQYDTSTEEYSTSAGSRATPARLRMTPVSVRAGPPVIPKSLPELRAFTGQDFLCTQRGSFLIAGDVELEDYEYLVDGVLDYCAAALVKTFFDKGLAYNRTVNIFVFKDYDSYELGLQRFLGMDPISPYGHYGHSQKYIVVNYETGPGTMVHELTHALMSEDFPEAPIWLGEGIASLYEHCRAEGDGLRGDDNWRLPEIKAALMANELTPLYTLLSMSPAAFRTTRESLNYAQARYFCKYLEEMGLLPTIYKDFRDNYALDPTGARFVVRAFGKPLETIDASWKRWITFQYWKE